MPAKPPAYGASVEVESGIHWARIPMPIAPHNVNVWLLEGKHGWTLVDAGWASDASRAAWRELLRSHGNPTIERVVCTHGHGDHASMLGWLIAYTGAGTLLMPRREWEWASGLRQGTDFPAHAAFSRVMGVPEPVVDFLKRWRAEFSRLFQDFPESFHDLKDGQRVDLGDLPFLSLCGGGHALDMAGMWCEDRRVLIAADHILPKIIPAQLMPLNDAFANPLGDQFAMMDRLEMLDAGALILPSHGAVFTGLAARIDAVKRYHRRQLEKLVAALDSPKTVWDMVPVFFGRDMPVDRSFMAALDVMSHLAYLASQHRIGRRWREDGAQLFYPVSG